MENILILGYQQWNYLKSLSSLVTKSWTERPIDCSPPVSSVHGILQARILEWVAVPFSTDFDVLLQQFFFHIIF